MKNGNVKNGDLLILLTFFVHVAREDMRLKETHFDAKVPQAGTHKVYLLNLIQTGASESEY